VPPTLHRRKPFEGAIHPGQVKITEVTRRHYKVLVYAIGDIEQRLGAAIARVQDAAFVLDRRL